MTHFRKRRNLAQEHRDIEESFRYHHVPLLIFPDTGLFLLLMTSLLEIKSAISHLNPRDRAVLTAELFALEEPDAVKLESALERGLQDVATGRVHPIEDVKKMIPQWISKS